MPSTPLLIVISAPSGGGKTTLCNQLLAKHSNITRAITCTTRAPRAGERDRIDYHFLERESFLNRIKRGEFLEHASVYENFYGSLKSEVMEKLAANFHVLLNIDVQGAAAIRQAALASPELGGHLLSVFLTPPSITELEERLKKRGSETPESFNGRLKKAVAEIAEWQKFDYLIVSTTIAEDLRRMEVVIEAEMMRRDRVVAPVF